MEFVDAQSMKQKKTRKNSARGSSVSSPLFNGISAEETKRIHINEEFRKANEKLMADIRKTLHSSLDSAGGSLDGALPAKDATRVKQHRPGRRGPGEK